MFKNQLQACLSGLTALGVGAATGLVFSTSVGAEAGKESASIAADLPPNAQAGECYARTFVPAVYETTSEKVLRNEASERIETIPARYELASQQVLVQDASTRLIEVPATYSTVTETIELEPARTVWRARQGRKAWDVDGGTVAAAMRLGLPEKADPGQCFAEYAIPARFETKQEQVLKSEASARIEIIPAKYEWAEERVVVKEAGTKIIEVPAVYETVTEQVLVKPAHKTWKKGRGPIERVDNTTGEIMCLVDVPAQYENVSKRVLKSPAKTQKLEIPAEYATMKVKRLVAPATEKRIEIPAEYTTVTKRIQASDPSRSWRAANAQGEGQATGLELCLTGIPAKTKQITRRVIKTPATTKQVEVPAEYTTVKLRKLVEPAQERRIAIPAEYTTVSKRNLVTDGRTSWVPVLCETNATPQLVTDIQRALKVAGYDPGPIDGVFGSQTMTAMRSFQRAKGLPSGGVTVATLDALQVNRGR